MRPMICAAFFVIACGHVAAQAEDRKYPYKAIIEVDGEYVRSGPGPSFYPTDKLRKGDKVMVHRHDPGGWCMISPPPGSFSWIKADHVQRSGENGGILKANNVVVHVGSLLSADEFTTIQGNLSKGEAVQILGEKTFPFDDGPKLMYKISPVRREWRWVQRKSIVAADAIQSNPFPRDSGPRAKPGPVADQIEPEPTAFQPISTGESGPDLTPQNQRPRPPAGPPGNAATEAAGFTDRLDTIDGQFREMIKQEPSTWDLNDIQRQYAQLDNEATLPAQSKTIAVRLDAVSRYEKTHRDYVNFLRTSQQSRQRDAELAAVQQQREAEMQALASGGPLVGPQSPTPLQPQPQVPQPVPLPQPTDGQLTASTVSTVATDNPQANAANQPKFVGAGVVVPMAQTFKGGPQYALVAPGGKLLAYLVPTGPGVDLRRSVSQSVGIIGERARRHDWGADVINVRSVQTVQLRSPR